MEITTAKVGTAIFKQGDPGNMFFLIKQGSVKVCIENINGDERVLKKGQFFGELALLYKAPRSATIIAKEDCIFVCITHTIFRKAMHEITLKNYDLAK